MTPQTCDELVWGYQPVVRLYQDRCPIHSLLRSSACQRVNDEAIEIYSRCNHNSHEVTVHIILVQVSQDLCGDLLSLSRSFFLTRSIYMYIYIYIIYGIATYVDVCV